MTEQLRIPVFEEEKLEEIKGDILQAGQIKKRIGSGYERICQRLLDSNVQVSLRQIT